ncbi:Uu.00g053740.m01.CDS01 [Anthostomella pinea]|uniref:Uu.00g053740.m01.CDS01 n=1 Tax=Anthostomella pinea TaxID=933095 RepID=A0AAI8VX75_9PEZI|nr:Uu.00g053740.m01.CDS01 [Anthostomella pinea]
MAHQENAERRAAYIAEKETRLYYRRIFLGASEKTDGQKYLEILKAEQDILSRAEHSLENYSREEQEDRPQHPSVGEDDVLIHPPRTTRANERELPALASVRISIPPMGSAKPYETLKRNWSNWWNDGHPSYILYACETCRQTSAVPEGAGWDVLPHNMCTLTTSVWALTKALEETATEAPTEALEEEEA